MFYINIIMYTSDVVLCSRLDNKVCRRQTCVNILPWARVWWVPNLPRIVKTKIKHRKPKCREKRKTFGTEIETLVNPNKEFRTGIIYRKKKFNESVKQKKINKYLIPRASVQRSGPRECAS